MSNDDPTDIEVCGAAPGGSDDPIPALYSERFVRALEFAVDAHRGQRRKGSSILYVGHLLGVCSLVIEEGCDEDTAIAALLHDAPEDQGGREMLDEIRAAFGDRVAEMVNACTDTFDTPKPPWRQRKEAYISHAAEEPRLALLMVPLADKLFNARSILRDHDEVGDEVWSRFNSGRDGALWYYTELSDVFSRLLPECRMSRELAGVVEELCRVAGASHQ